MAHGINIYPFKPFKDLADKRLQDRFQEAKKITLDDLKQTLDRVHNPPPNISGSDIEERILSIFLDPNYLYGPDKYISSCKDVWIEKFRRFTDKEKPLKFVLMACPFKVPVPLKTLRVTVDIAELLLIIRLRNIAIWIETIYEPGAVVTILAEGILGEGIGVPIEDRMHYRESLEHSLSLIQTDPYVSIHNIDDIHEVIPNFQIKWDERSSSLRLFFNQGDTEVRSRFQRSFSSIYHMIPTRELKIENLMDIYNEKIPTESLPEDQQTIRGRLNEAATEAVFKYLAFLDVRDETGYLEKIVPDNLKLTLSPKPLNLGIHPINAHTDILPHHAIPVYDLRFDHFTMKYWIDIRRSSSSFRPVYLVGDNEDAPFYYEQLED